MGSASVAVSVGGIVNNRRVFPQLPGADHMRHTQDLGRNAFSRGQPEHGADLADDLERLVALHGAETIAAVIVEPVAGSTGVLIPPKGYLERLRATASKHGVLLIFDEVITGFGRLGAPFAADYFRVKPDLISTAKGLTNGCVPMGAVFANRVIHDRSYDRTGIRNRAVPWLHVFGSSVGCAAGLATLEIYIEEMLLTRGAELATQWQEAIHSLRGLSNVIDIRTIGLIAGIELAPREGQPGARAYETFVKAFEKNVLIRFTGDVPALSPPLILEFDQIDQIVSTLRSVLAELY
ncbi:MAG: aminotransferase class III-fold pyridoxal phosphate-dependent enzyme [Roseiarcus sp.]